MKLSAIILVLTTFLVSSYGQDLPGQYPQASTRLLVREDIFEMDAAELKIVRNEIFARYGYIFRSEDLKKHFEGQSWYKPSSAEVTHLLSDLEKKNVAFVRQWESRLANTSEFDSFFRVFTKAVAAGDVEQLCEMVWIDYFESTDMFRKSYEIHRSDVEAAIRKGIKPRTGDATTKSLMLGEFYNGVQYQWIEFQKQGCCWFIFRFGMAG